MGIVADIFRESLTLAPQVTAAEWLRRNFYTHDGRAFNEASCPWVTAPQGPCWAYDSIQFRTIWLQWAARMFKTNFGLGMLMRSNDQRPEETMFATPDETNCKSVFGRFWKMIEHCPRLRDQTPPANRQNKTRISLRRSVCHGAWPRGKSRLADKSIRIGHGNEIDKWENQSTSTEGDPLERFRKRGAEHPDRKFVLESTPSVRGKSNIESGRLQSTNHRFHVPCPHCFKFQTIEYGDGSGPGMIHFDKLPNGTSCKDLARRTAHYVCLHCEGRIDDMHRPFMMGQGVWVPAGCEVDHERAMIARELPPDDMSWLIGDPINWGSEYGSQLSVFYALFHGWGNIAYDHLAKHKNTSKLRQWINEDKGETWEIIAKKQTWEELGQRLVSTVPTGVVPASHSIVTIGVDKQSTHYVYSVDSWGSEHTSHTVQYGTCETTQELRALLTKRWPREESEGLMPSVMLIDSGFLPAEVHRFVAQCQRDRLPVRACRGSSTKLSGFYEQKVNQKNSSNPGQMVIWIDPHSTQDWVEQRLHSIKPGEAGAMTVYSDSLENHQDWLQQVMNDGLSSRLNAQNNVTETWERIDTMVPNDFRDCKRYSFVGMLLANRGRKIQSPATATKPIERKHKTPLPNFIERPGGWLRGIQQQ
jgi:phage terminase large subunit GpA-like protein